MKRLLMIILFLLAGSLLLAEHPPELEGDRPDFTESPNVVPFGSIQLEGGYTLSSDGTIDEHSLGELLLRIGVYHRLELRLGINSMNWSEAGGNTEFGKDDPSLGAKIQILYGTDTFNFLKPDISLIIGTSIPVGTTEFTENKWQPEAKLSIGWSLTERLGAGINLNYSYLYGYGWYSQFSGSAVVGISIIEDLGGYGEYIVYAPEANNGNTAHYLSAGLTWMITKTVQVDGRFGIQIHDDNDYFTGIGFIFLWPSVW